MAPIPHASSWEELNSDLEADHHERRRWRLRGQTETIGEHIDAISSNHAAIAVRAVPAREKITARVNSLSLVRYRTNDYSVLKQYAYRTVLVKTRVHRVELGCSREIIARHERSYAIRGTAYAYAYRP